MTGRGGKLQGERGNFKVAEDRDAKKPEAENQISEHTGQYDTRFMLWRAFCSQNNVPVETLPGDLKGEVRERWEKLKNNQLRKPTEEK